MGWAPCRWWSRSGEGVFPPAAVFQQAVGVGLSATVDAFWRIPRDARFGGQAGSREEVSQAEEFPLANLRRFHLKTHPTPNCERVER